jgi:molybdopterin-guanine dinucleotide biosynthesis protein A
MGRDKGLMSKDGIPWALYVAAKLKAQTIPVVFSINEAQRPGYSAQLPGHWLIFDDAALNLGGPLQGLVSVHHVYPGYDIFLLACDMLDMDEATITGLMDAWQSGGADFYAYREEDFYQPLCAIYTAAGLHTATNSDSLQTLLRQGRTTALPILRTEPFRNYNTL